MCTVSHICEISSEFKTNSPIYSVGCGDSMGAIPTPTYRNFEHQLEAKTKAENELKMYTNMVSETSAFAITFISFSLNSNVFCTCALSAQAWTIIRPGGLKNEEPTGKAILTEDKLASGAVTRKDVADMIIKVLDDPGVCTRRELTCVDPVHSPGYVFTPFAV